MPRPARSETSLLVLSTLLTAFAALLLAGGFLAPSADAASDKKVIKQFQREIAESLASGDRQTAQSKISGLIEVNTLDAFEALMPFLGAISVEMEEAWLVSAFGKFDGAVLQQGLVDLVTSKKVDPNAASFAVWLAPKVSAELQNAVLVASFDAPLLVVTRAALADFADKPTREGVGGLIEKLQDKKLDRMIRREIEWTLQQVTLQDIELAADWDRWWKLNGESFDPNAEPEDGATAVARKKDDDAPEFFGEAIEAERVVFVIDVSGSMQLWDPSKEGGSSSKGWTERRRITRTQAQLIQVIGKMPKQSYFSILSFGHQVLSFVENQLVPASTRSKRRAIKWVDDLGANGRTTQTLDGLEAAFKVPGVDTIILLSDGAPTDENRTPTESLMQRCLSRVKQLNKVRRVRIHTFGFDGGGRRPPGQGDGPVVSDEQAKSFRDFLTKLAQENDGKYTSIQ